MEAAPRPRGRLSRRRPPSRDGPPSRCPWFLQGDSEGHPWAMLLRMVSSERAQDSDLLPPLPTFPSQEPGPGPECASPPEIFTVGPKSFSWTPFPPAPGGLGCSYRLLRRAREPLESPTQSQKEHSTPDPCGTPSAKEQLSVEGPPALRSCPMCQKEFPTSLTQLDQDSHLAQCLAESTEDMDW